MRERTDMPTSYNAGTGIGRSRHPWDPRSWLRDSTKIHLATCGVLRRGRFRLHPHAPWIFKERAVSVSPNWGCLWTNTSYLMPGGIAVSYVTVCTFSFEDLPLGAPPLMN